MNADCKRHQCKEVALAKGRGWGPFLQRPVPCVIGKRMAGGYNTPLHYRSKCNRCLYQAQLPQGCRETQRSTKGRPFSSMNEREHVKVFPKPIWEVELSFLTSSTMNLTQQLCRFLLHQELLVENWRAIAARDESGTKAQLPCHGERHFPRKANISQHSTSWSQPQSHSCSDELTSLHFALSQIREQLPKKKYKEGEVLNNKK